MKKVIAVITALVFILVLAGAIVFKLPAFGGDISRQQEEQLKKSQQYRSEKGIFVNQQENVIELMRKDFSTFNALMEWIKSDGKKAPLSKLPEVKPDLQSFLSPSSDLKLIWLGHSTFLLNMSGVIILVDPVFGPSAAPFSFLVKRFQAPILSLEELPKIDYIVISHDHYDHLDMPTMKFFANKDVQFLVPLGIGTHLNRWGVDEAKITQMDWWQSKTVQDIEFVATPAQHFSGRSPFAENKTLWASWVIRSKSHSVYFSGDSGYNKHYKEIGDKYGPFDIAFIENGQYNEKWRAVHNLPEESVQAYFDLKAKRFLPVHWGMFVLSLHSWREPADKLLELSKVKGVNIITPKLGEMVTLNDSYKNVEWWLDLN
jgi:L-ascorbate metabolism protein UlaG (beta-lactamase superfamily)